LGEGGLDRAKLFEQEAEDQGDAAQMGALNVINTVEGMDLAYQEFGKTLDTIHDKLRKLGKKSYSKKQKKADVKAAKEKAQEQSDSY
jgi:hypothetical protein